MERLINWTFVYYFYRHCFIVFCFQNIMIIFKIIYLWKKWKILINEKKSLLFWIFSMNSNANILLNRILEVPSFFLANSFQKFDVESRLKCLFIQKFDFLCSLWKCYVKLLCSNDKSVHYFEFSNSYDEYFFFIGRQTFSMLPYQF